MNIFLIKANNLKNEIKRIQEFLDESQNHTKSTLPDHNNNINLNDSFNLNYTEFNHFSSDNDFFSN